MSEPCSRTPPGVTKKAIGLHCRRCDRWGCWRRYLSWEKAAGYTLNQSAHPVEVDDEDRGYLA